MLALGLSATGFRIIKQYQTPGPFDDSRQGYCDFHNGVYYPSLAFLRGVSPYGPEYAADYPVARQIPFFSPMILVLHAPFALLPLRVAEISYFIVSIMVLYAIAALCAAAAGARNRLDIVLAIMAGAVFTRCGHITLFDGYFTFELALGTFLAIHWADRRPLLAGLALMIASGKPTFLLPLGFLMLARGNYKALLWGAALSIISVALPLAWLAHHEGNGNLVEGTKNVLEHIKTSQEIHLNEPNESPVKSWTRLDLLAVIAKWRGADPGQLTHLAVMGAVLLVPIVLLVKRRRLGLDDGLAGMTGALILITILVSIYHQSYDAMLIAAPLSGLLICQVDAWKSLSRTWQRLLILLLLIPPGNYLSTQMVLKRFDPESNLVLVATSLNGIALALLLTLLCGLAFQQLGKRHE
jgi:hypothetical protein